MSKRVFMERRSGTARRKADALLWGGRSAGKEIAAGETERLLHVFELRQIELERQNEDLRKAWAQSEESRNRYYDLYDLAPIAYFTLDGKGLIREVNLAGARLLGVERELLKGQALAQFVAPDSRGAYFAHRKRVFSTGTREVSDIRLLRRPVASVYVRMESVAAKDASGLPDVEWAILTDITDHKRNEKELLRTRDELEMKVKKGAADLLSANRMLQLDVEERRQTAEALLESEMRYSSLIENALVGVMVYRNGKAQFVNREFADIWGYSRDSILDMDPMDLVHPEDRAAILARGVLSLKGKSFPAEYELRGLRRDGRTLWLYGRAILIIHEKRPAVLINVVDITRRKHIEDALRASEGELRLLSSRLLSAQDEERRRIGRDLHDVLGQSLTAIKVRLENAICDTSQEFPPACLGPFKNVVPLLADAIGEIRRIEKGLWPSVLDGLGLKAAISWLCREFRETYAHITLDTEIDVDEQGMSLEIKTAAFRIIQEALSNTARHSRADRVFVCLSRVDGGMGLAVRDTGKGFDPARPSGEKPTHGLGLTSMRERAEFTGGSFTVESAEDQGTSVLVTWPATAFGGQGSVPG